MDEKEYTSYKCISCNKTFILPTEEVDKNKYLTCPHDGRHKKIIVTGAYDSVKECMKERSYKRDKGKMKQIK